MGTAFLTVCPHRGRRAKTDIFCFYIPGSNRSGTFLSRRTVTRPTVGNDFLKSQWKYWYNSGYSITNIQPEFMLFSYQWGHKINFKFLFTFWRKGPCRHTKEELPKVKSSLRCKTLRTSFSLCQILLVLITEWSLLWERKVLREKSWWVECLSIRARVSDLQILHKARSRSRPLTCLVVTERWEAETGESTEQPGITNLISIHLPQTQ